MTSKCIAEEYAHRIWHNKDLTAIDELFSSDAIIHSILGDFYGQEPLKKVVQVWFQGFPDLVVKNREVIKDRDLVAIMWHAEGSHRGDFKGKKPTFKPVSYNGISIYRVKNDKIIEYWAFLDMQHLYSQIS